VLILRGVEMAMLKIEETGFGYIVVDGRKYRHDIVIHVDGKISKRKKELSKPFKRGIHTPLSWLEIAHLLEENPEIIIIGTGQYGALPILEETVKYMENHGVSFIKAKTPEAIKILNTFLKEGRRVASIIHVTC